jgi:hypothetical protein
MDGLVPREMSEIESGQRGRDPSKGKLAQYEATCVGLFWFIVCHSVNVKAHLQCDAKRRAGRGAWESILRPILARGGHGKEQENPCKKTLEERARTREGAVSYYI